MPIIKFVDIDSGLNFDLSFNKQDGIFYLSPSHRHQTNWRSIEGVLNLPWGQVHHLHSEVHAALARPPRNLPGRHWFLLALLYGGGVLEGVGLCVYILVRFRRDHHKQNANLSTEKQQSLQEVLLSEYILKILDFYGSRFDISRKRIVMIDVPLCCIKRVDESSTNPVRMNASPSSVHKTKITTSGIRPTRSERYAKYLKIGTTSSHTTISNPMRVCWSTYWIPRRRSSPSSRSDMIWFMRRKIISHIKLKFLLMHQQPLIE